MGNREEYIEHMNNRAYIKRQDIVAIMSTHTRYWTHVKAIHNVTKSNMYCHSEPLGEESFLQKGEHK